MKLKNIRQIIIMSSHLLLLIFLQSLLGGLLYANDGLSQSAKLEEVFVSIKGEDVRLKEVLNKLSNQTDFTFSYNNEIVNDQERLNISFNNSSLYDVLVFIAKDRKLNFKRINENIHINIASNIELAQLIQIEASKQIEVKGKVVSSVDNEPLPGVSILVKGTSKGTTTDIDGNYSLYAFEGDVLQFSYIGFLTQEIALVKQVIIDVTMKPDLEQLEEIVVVGYQAKERRDLTGSISSISSEDIAETQNGSFVQALQGKVSGVMVRSNSGQPGGGVSVRIRGIGGINNSEPLYVVDGIQIVGTQNEGFNGLTSINPNDIESIEILKDASSAAIYGARGANGVVIITTKRGSKDGKPKFSYSGTFGIQNRLNAGGLETLNAREYAEFVNDAVIADGGEAVFGGPNTDQFPADLFPAPSALGNGTDHLGELFRTAPMQEHQISLSGGNLNTQYYFSLNYLNQDGILETTSFKRYAVRFNSDTKVNKFLKFGNSFGLSRALSNPPSATSRMEVSGNITNAIATPPTIGIYNPDGTFAGPPNAFYNPARVAFAEISSIERHQVNNDFNGNIYAQLDLLEGLSLKSSLGFNLNSSRFERFVPTFSEGISLSNVSQVRESFSEGTSYNWSNVLSYNKELGNHTISALVGTEALDVNFSFMNGNATYPDNAIKIVSSAGALNSNINQYKGGSSLLSYFGSVSYNYKSKYYIESNLRRDGSSRFGENNRWGVFPSVSMAWRLSQEAFFNVPFIEDLKIRGSYGEVGNDKIGDFAYIAALRNVVYPFGGNNGNFSVGQAIDALSNADLRWETSRQTNIGLDLSMFSGKLNFTAEYFETDVEDMLLGIPIAATSGISNSFFTIDLATVTANSGSLTNKGFEFELDYSNNIGDFSYDLGFNLTTYTNEVTNIGDNKEIFGAVFQGQNVSRTVVGGNLGEFYGYVVDGIFQNQAEVDAANNLGGDDIPFQNENTAPGDFRFRDLNGDNVITDADRTTIGSPIPDFTYGLNMDFAYKNFNLSLLWYGVEGNDIYNSLRMDLEASGRVNQNKSRATLGAWSGEGTSNTIPRRIASDPNQNKRVSSNFVEDGSFLALRDIRLGYTIPENLASKLTLASARVYVSAQNYLMFTKYSGFDPEVGNIGGNNLGAGIDYDFYPRAKSIQFGLNVNF